MCWTDDPVRDFDRWDMAMERKKARCHKGECAHCREAVYSYDEHYDVMGEYLLHADCLVGYMDRYLVQD